MRTVGEIIKNWRKKHRLTQKNLAKLLRVSLRTVSYWEEDSKYPRQNIVIDKLQETIPELEGHKDLHGLAIPKTGWLIGELHSISGDTQKEKVSLIAFHCFDKLVGELVFKGKKLHFKGDAEKSAKFLFDRLKQFVEEYIVQRLQLGSGDTKVSWPLSLAKLAQSTSETTNTQFAKDIVSLFLKWFKQARKPGDKFIVEIDPDVKSDFSLPGKEKEKCQNSK